jgi:hypothetical protein
MFYVFSVFCLPWFEIKHNKKLLCKKVKKNQSGSQKLDIQGHYANPGNKERKKTDKTNKESRRVYCNRQESPLFRST